LVRGQRCESPATRARFRPRAVRHRLAPPMIRRCSGDRPCDRTRGESTRRAHHFRVESVRRSTDQLRIRTHHAHDSFTSITRLLVEAGRRYNQSRIRERHRFHGHPKRRCRTAIYTNRHALESWQGDLRRSENLPWRATLSYGGEGLGGRLLAVVLVRFLAEVGHLGANRRCQLEQEGQPCPRG